MLFAVAELLVSAFVDDGAQQNLMAFYVTVIVVDINTIEARSIHKWSDNQRQFRVKLGLLY